MRPITKIALVTLSLAMPCLAATEDTLTQMEMADAPLPEGDLESLRARGNPHTMINIDDIDVQLNKVDLDAKLDHNVVHSATTGDNSVSHDAFAGSTGFMTVIQNTGNNVIIQNATIVNFSLQQ